MLWDENADGANGHLENLGKAYLRTKPTWRKVQMKYGKVMQYPWWSLSEDYMYSWLLQLLDSLNSLSCLNQSELLLKFAPKSGD